ncbi:murein biosynthesis integral membrane protein MurJ [Aquibacillus salsiterrae]|uniref:Probable lipid II flippase MurJ n=1 Tax=Aquibacillus salsiterrae TaxID=2950439 RepID=A0A9X3WEV2_9BACI|nr:murein biosynthesis integral membrane protein MurJ [Aquibacillus salsiterrae]MDC3416114.1 murein biosynthesis integral membrane protein MurJ [Aquibacillus salsiterrae]
MQFLKIVGAVAAINMVARLFGFFREVVIGYQYGTSYQADSIITAFTIPNFLYLVLGGAITTAFISIYSKLEDRRDEAFLKTLFTGLTVVVGAVTLLFMVIPNFWIKLFFAGMSDEAYLLTRDLFVWMAPSTFFLVISMWLSGVLNVHNKYQFSAFSTLVFNGLFLIAGIVFYPTIGAFAYGIGATIAAILMAVVLFWYVKRTKIVPLSFGFEKMPELKRFLKLALPILFGGATLQFYFFIQRIYATGLPDGAIASLNYASKMTQFPQAILMTAVTTVIYPMLAKLTASTDRGKLEAHYRKGIRLLFVLLIPATVFVYVYAKEIITVIFQYGNFTVDSTNQTYPLLQVFSWSMVALAINMYITRFFYALENSYLPVVFNILSVFGVNILVIQLFIETQGANAIALGTSISTIFNMICMMLLAKRMYHFSLFTKKIGMKMIGYLLLSTALIAGFSFVAIPFMLVDVTIGGVITAISIVIGMKVFQ